MNGVAVQLTKTDLAALERCGITAELAERAGLFRADSVEGARLMGRNGSGSGNYAGIVFPYRLPGGDRPREFRLRRDHPDLEQSGSIVKEKAKYLSPPGAGNRFYFPPDVNPESLRDPTIPILFVEGEKKSLALSPVGLSSAGPQFIPIGLAGVWGWRGVVGKGPDSKGARSDIKGPIPDFDLFEWRNRTVYLMFDLNVRTNEKVRTARSALKAELKKRGAKVRLIDLPELEGVNGPDDLLALKGSEFILRLIQNATLDLTGGPSQWLSDRFPGLQPIYGDPLLEEIDKRDIVSVRGINEDFLAATLGDKGTPDAPTVHIPTERRFFTYSERDGVYILRREPALLAQISGLLLDCARATKGGDCKTEALEFRFRDSARLLGVLRKAKAILEVNPDFFSTDLTEYIPCANGMLNLSDNVLLPFSPSYRRRNKLAVDFDPDARCPIFLDTLMRPALEPDDLDLLQRWCSLALIGENLAQVLLILIGLAGTGKGCFVRVLNGIIGQMNLASLRPQLLGERFELGRFLGKNLLYGADVPENFLNQRGASVLKSLTGYDPMTLEFKNSNESPFIICRFNVIVTCNSRLTVHLEGDTDAWRRRLVIVDYHKPKPAKVIADLDQQILSTEASGVLNWMLEGLAKLRDDGWQLKLNENQQARVDNLLLESDGHSLFIKEELTRSKDGSLTVHECFAAYADYCTERGWSILSRNKFGQVIGDIVARQHGLTVRHDIRDASGKAQRGWRGLSLRCKDQINSTNTGFMDEVWFPPGSTDAEIDAISAKALETTT